MKLFENILKSVWRSINRYKLSKRNVRIYKTAIFNNNTTFGGHNSIGAKTVVSDSQIGRYTYLGKNNKLDRVSIGKFCSIGSNIKILDSTHPTREFVSTSPVFYSTLCQCGTTFVTKDKFEEHLSGGDSKLIIGNDVWIGDDVTFMAGITIGDGAIIGTGALVTKDVPPFSICGGIPAKVIRYRFTQEQIDYLQTMKWWNKDDQWIRANADRFDSIERFMREITLER